VKVWVVSSGVEVVTVPWLLVVVTRNVVEKVVLAQL
jgi:hypothetical protein